MDFVLRSKTVTTLIGSVSETLTSALRCDDTELYKTSPLLTATMEIVQSGGVNKIILQGTNVILHPNAKGRCALVYVPQTNISAIVSAHLNTVEIEQTYYYEATETTDVETLTSLPSWATTYIESGNASVSTNIPIFATTAEADAYLLADDPDQALFYLTKAINYESTEYEPEETKVWTYSCIHSEVNLLRGTITPGTEIGWRTEKIQANKRPAFYLNEGSFEMSLVTSDVVASVYVAGPESVIENLPESSWTAGEVVYNGPFYCPLSVYVQHFGQTPGDGDYTYPTQFQTNIDIFANREDAEEAIQTGDYSKAIRMGPIWDYDVKIGTEEEETVFGGGGFISPFMTILSGSKSDLHRLADFLFNSDPDIWDAVKKGLEMYGSNPIDYIISCRAFGFDVSQVVNESTRHDIYFGSYLKHFDNPFNEVINMAHKYIDAGSFFMYPIQYCYLDFEPYTVMSAWFPYHGWEQLDIKKYYNKTVNVRYYVDILSGQAIIVTLCNGIVTDQFGPCEMGTELPLTGANFAQWAQGQVRLLAQAGQTILAGGINGAAGGPVAAAGGMLASAPAASMNIFEAKQQGGPKNTMITKGNFGSNLMNYLPGYVIFRFDIHEMLEPQLLTPLAGRPSYSSGTLRNFSGFVAGKVVKLDTSGMTDSEAERIKSLILSGIYI